MTGAVVGAALLTNMILLNSVRASTGGTVELDATNGCTTCSGGDQCNARGLTAPTGTEVICDAGFYCVDATSSVACGRGYYCPANSRA